MGSFYLCFRRFDKCASFYFFLGELRLGLGKSELRNFLRGFGVE